jgi:hypothetical protein
MAVFNRDNNVIKADDGTIYTVEIVEELVRTQKDFKLDLKTQQETWTELDSEIITLKETIGESKIQIQHLSSVGNQMMNAETINGKLNGQIRTIKIEIGNNFCLKTFRGYSNKV